MKRVITTIFLTLMLSITGVYASSNQAHKIVIQVSSKNVKTQNLALNNAKNLMRAFKGNAVIEVVAYGPGLTMLMGENAISSRVSTLETKNIRFSACSNTMHAFQRRTGSLPILTDGVKVVPSGASRIVLLQEQGYSYIRP